MAVPFDFEVEPGCSAGEWLRGEITRECYEETTGWAPERARRVADRLQAGRPAAERLEPVVLWMDEPTAFTAPGRYVYLSRFLLERCPSDESAAFVVAHEIAHHDLGHVELFPRWMVPLLRTQAGIVCAALFQAVERRVYGPERECDADRRALDLCLRAGYDADECLYLFDMLEMVSLDLGDRAMVFGPEDSDGELLDDASWATRARMWAWQRSRGYLPIRDRREALREHLGKRGAAAQVLAA